MCCEAHSSPLSSTSLPPPLLLLPPTYLPHRHPASLISQYSAIEKLMFLLLTTFSGQSGPLDKAVGGLGRVFDR